MSWRFTSLAALLALAPACHSGDRRTAGADHGLDLGRGDDPCVYVAQSEAEAYVGPLVTPPYRYDESNGAPSAGGGKCLYRGRDGREITVDPLAGGAKIAIGVMTGVPRVVGRMVQGSGHEEMAHVPAGMVQTGPAGPWDKASWAGLTETLVAVKGDSGVIIDVSASSAGEAGAYALARDAMPRLDVPLEYDGGRAATLAPVPRTPLANPCTLIPRARVEQAIGTLSGEPQPDASATTCTYRVAAAGGPQAYPLDITWTHGYKELTMMKRSISAAGSTLGMPSQAATPIPPAAQEMLGQFAKAMGGSATAAPITHPLETDTALVGPWDAAALVSGKMLAATRHDVMVRLMLTTADYDRAKALLAAACEQL